MDLGQFRNDAEPDPSPDGGIVALLIGLVAVIVVSYVAAPHLSRFLSAPAIEDTFSWVLAYIVTVKLGGLLLSAAHMCTLVSVATVRGPGSHPLVITGQVVAAAVGIGCGTLAAKLTAIATSLAHPPSAMMGILLILVAAFPAAFTSLMIALEGERDARMGAFLAGITTPVSFLVYWLMAEHPASFF